MATISTQAAALATGNFTQTPGEFLDAALAYARTHTAEEALGWLRDDAHALTQAAIARFSSGAYDSQIAAASTGALFAGVALLVIVVAVLTALFFYARWVVRRNRRLTGKPQWLLMGLIFAVGAFAPTCVAVPLAIHFAITLKGDTKRATVSVAEAPLVTKKMDE